MFARPYSLTAPAVLFPLRLVLHVVCALIGALAANAADLEAKLDAIHEACGEEYGFPGAIALCLQKKDAEYGDELTRVYEHHKSTFAGVRRTLLIDSQRAWLKYQSSTCQLLRLSLESEGAGIAQAGAARCALRATMDRLRELEELR